MPVGELLPHVGLKFSHPLSREQCSRIERRWIGVWRGGSDLTWCVRCRYDPDDGLLCAMRSWYIQPCCGRCDLFAMSGWYLLPWNRLIVQFAMPVGELLPHVGLEFSNPLSQRHGG